MFTQHIDALRWSFRKVQQRHLFHINAIIILPDHCYLMTLPQEDVNYSTCISKSLGLSAQPTIAILKIFILVDNGMNRNSGYTLIEILITLLVLSILLFFGTSSLSNMLSKNEREVIIDELKVAVDFARIQSMNKNIAFELISINSDSNWNQGAQLVKINNKSSKEIIHEWQWGHPHWSISWHGVNSAKKIKFSPDPLQAISNGRFILKNLETKERVEVVLNRLGRLREERG